MINMDKKQTHIKRMEIQQLTMITVEIKQVLTKQIPMVLQQLTTNMDIKLAVISQMVKQQSNMINMAPKLELIKLIQTEL